MRTAILISGRGSNMAAILDAARAPDYPARPVLVIANKPDAGGLALAREYGVKTQVVPSRGKARADFDAELDRALRAEAIELVALAGFMRILTEGFVTAWAGRMVNIHPSLLPAYKGVDTHARALADGVRITGCSVHFVTPGMDEGPVIAQAALPILFDDTAQSLAARVLRAEHHIYPAALAAVARGDVYFEEGQAVWRVPPRQDGAPLYAPHI